MQRQLNPEVIQFLPWSKDKDWPSRRLIVCKQYRKPEKVGRIFLPETHLEDKSGTLWEVVKASVGAKRYLGTFDVREGDIVKVRGHDFPVGLDATDERDGRDLVCIDAAAVYQMWKVEEESNG